jgi:hypothetical protein
MREIVAVLLLLAVAPLYSQESINRGRLAKADTVVVGVLYSTFTFPWLDGWNERGYIQVERVLKGDVGNVRRLPFAWERVFGQTWCLNPPDWRGEIGKRGIWVLTKERNRYRAPDPFGGFLDPANLDDVVHFLAEHSPQTP